MLPMSKKTGLFAGAAWLVLLALLLAAIPGGVGVSAASGTIKHTTLDNFAASTGCASGAPVLSGVSITEDGTGPTDVNRGEIALAATFEDYFPGTSLNTTKWATGVYTDTGGPGNVSVAGGALSIAPKSFPPDVYGSVMGTRDTFRYGVLEGVVTFDGDTQTQHFGWADGAFETNRYAIFSTGSGNLAQPGLYARTNSSGSEISSMLSPTVPTGPQRLKIVWKSEPLSPTTPMTTTDVIEYYVNNMTTPAHTIRFADTTDNMEPPTYAIGDLNLPALSVTYSNSAPAVTDVMTSDWVRYTPYAGTSGTYTSCVLSEPGATSQVWTVSSLPAAQPAGTTATVKIRTGDTLPLSGDFVAAPNGLQGKYVQYQVALTTTDTAKSPKVEEVTLVYGDLPTLSIANSSVMEGTTGASTPMNFSVTLSKKLDKDVTFKYSTQGGTATAGTDYTAVTGQTATIAAGQLSTTVSVVVKGDTAKEGNETFNVVLSDPANATIADGQALGTIIDDDDGVKVWLAKIDR